MPHAGQTIKPLVQLGKRPDDCWVYLGPTTPAGYGKKQVNGRTVSAVRWLWETLFGPLPLALVVAHSCGNAGCVNPQHLRATTQAEANRAGIAAMLTPAEVREIKAAKKGHTHHTAAHLAQRHGCSPQTVHDIWARRSWGMAGARSRASSERSA